METPPPPHPAADLAAQCSYARAQAKKMLRLVRKNEGDLGSMMQLNAQYGSMVRTSLSVHGRPMRVQAVRQNREAIEGAASNDAWILHVAEQSMLKVVNPASEPQQAPRPAAEQAADPDQTTKQTVSENGTISQDMAFETWMSKKPWHHGSKASGKTAVRKAIAGSHSRGRELSANTRDSPGMAG